MISRRIAGSGIAIKGDHQHQSYAKAYKAGSQERSTKKPRTKARLRVLAPVRIPGPKSQKLLKRRSGNPGFGEGPGFPQHDAVDSEASLLVSPVPRLLEEVLQLALLLLGRALRLVRASLGLLGVVAGHCASGFFGPALDLIHRSFALVLAAALSSHGLLPSPVVAHDASAAADALLLLNAQLVGHT